MLEHVALGQTRFLTPGVAPDPRGIVLGRHGLLVFPTLEGVVSWFRIYAAESALDELLSSLEIAYVKSPLGGRAMTVRIPASSSYALDRAARCAHLVGGTTYTGTTKHFVRYRDDRSPYGYDATDIQALPAGQSLAVHGDGFVQTYQVDGEISFAGLLGRLSLRRIPGSEKLPLGERHELVLAVERGLGQGVIRYLWRNRGNARVALVTRQGDSVWGDQPGGRSFLLFRVADLPRRMVELFLATPGITVFRPIGANLATELGWAHPIDLSSCGSVFEADKLYLFRGAPSRVDVVAGPVEMSGIEHLTRVDLRPETAQALPDFEAGKVDAVGVTIELAPSMAPPRRLVGALIPLEQAAWLKRLVYLLPQSSLRGHRIAVTDHGILVVAQGEVDVIPLGQPLAELAPGLVVPLGMDLVPRVAPDVLARSLGHGPGILTVFPPGGAPFQVKEDAMQPLERRAVAKIEVARAEVADVRAAAVAEPSVVNDPVGRFALWGFRVPSGE